MIQTTATNVVAPASIMVVDDQPANLKLMADMLKQQGYSVCSFPRGRMALTAARERPPDLILLDINMPEMDAWGFLDEFETLYPALGKKIGIYIISSQILPIHKHRLKLYKHVKGLINKPFDKKSLNDFLLEVSI